MMRITCHRDFYSLLGRIGGFRVLVFTLLALGNGVIGEFTEAPTDFVIEDHLRRLDKPAIKTIQSEDGDIVDCVDIYKQPAFDHPLLKNHTIQMRPSYIPEILDVANSSEVIVQQLWQKSGSCPKGTIPIQRTRKSDVLRASSLENYGVDAYEKGTCRVEKAGAQANSYKYKGISARINVWSPFVVDNEWSLNSVSVVDQMDSIESGVGVSPILFGDNWPRYYASWRGRDRGCYNLKCPGFVQVSSRLMLGAAAYPVSIYTGQQYEASTSIYKDDYQQKWWLLVLREVVGYWPQSLFSHLDTATQLQWAGSVCNTQTEGLHTTTGMGSGHYPGEGYSRSAYFRNVFLSYDGAKFVAPRDWGNPMKVPGCYDIRKWNLKGDEGPGFFYGGPGGVCCDGRRCNQTAIDIELVGSLE